MAKYVEMSCNMLPQGVSVIFQYQSIDWNDAKFERHGGFVAVVLNYNKLNYITQACQSAFHQDYPCYEILLMDDASVDGSDRIMLKCAKEFAQELEIGKHTKSVRISVVKNSINQSTLGQWHIAASISQGTWFFMFCGDDISYGHRLKTGLRLIERYPLAKGICTSGDADNGERLGPNDKTLVWSGAEGELPLLYWLGCTSIWHRDVLSVSFGRHNLDDFILFWCSVILGQDSRLPVLVWALNESTISYRVGPGVSTSDQKLALTTRNPLLRLWRCAISWKKFEKKFGSNTWQHILEFDKVYGKPGRVREWIRGYYHCAVMGTCGWQQRVKTLYRVMFIERSDSYGGVREYVVNTVRRRFWLQIAGPISFVIGLTLEGIWRRLSRYIGGGQQ